MYVGLKNKSLVGLAVILAVASFNNASANPKTWTKDASGRVLVYRADPSKLEAACMGLFTAFGFPFIGASLLEHDKPMVNRTIVAFAGACISGLGIYGLSLWYHNYSSLFKPLIIMDRSGITYEGKDKISWKRICGYENVRHTVYIDGVRHEDNYLEISTDLDKLQIHERDIAVTLPMLYKLIDESYKEYQKLEKESVVA